MNASKENAIKAAEALRAALVKHPGIGRDIDFVADFLIAAHKKLPTEAAFAADKARSRKTA